MAIAFCVASFVSASVGGDQELGVSTAVFEPSLLPLGFTIHAGAIQPLKASGELVERLGPKRLLEPK